MRVRLGIDVACRADHQASLAGVDGEFIWSGWRFRTTPTDLAALWEKIPAGAEVQVIIEPTRNAWVPLAAWLSAQGADVVLVAPEQSADLRDYDNKHTKTDRLDSRVLARLPLLHPEGLAVYDGPTPADPLRRVMRRRSKLVKARVATFQRLDALLELLGPAWAEVLGAGDYTKTALVVLERYGNPRALRRLGLRRLSELMIRTSKGAWREDKAVAVKDVTLDQTALRRVLDPAHPLADADGYVDMSNVDMIVETADARQAKRSFEANLEAFRQARETYSNLVNLLRR